MRDALGVNMGRVHAIPIGPHPRGSYQMTVSREKIGTALEWLLAHRGSFTVFVHGNSGTDLAGHMRHALWLGLTEPLNLVVFAPSTD
jgi:aromatic ring-cleaving dioxygenase